MLKGVVLRGVTLASLLCLSMAHSDPRDCIVALREAAQPAKFSTADFQEQIRDFFLYQTAGPYLARGLLVETASGQKIFTLGEYLGVLHRLMLRGAESSSPSDPIVRLLWIGEIAFEKRPGLDPNSKDDFVFQHGNQTSGMYFNAVTPGPDHRPISLGGDETKKELAEVLNDGAQLIKFIEEAGLLKTNDFGVESYDKKHPHLLLDISLEDKDTLLHNFRNSLNVVPLHLSMMVYDGKIDPHDVTTATKNLEVIVLPILAHLRRMYDRRSCENFCGDLDFTNRVLQDLLIAHRALDAANSVPAEIEARLLDAANLVRLTATLHKIALAVHNIELATSISLPTTEGIEINTIEVFPKIYSFGLSGKGLEQPTLFDHP